MALFGFGKRKPKPLTLIPFSQDPPRRLRDLLCDGVLAENLTDFATLLDLHTQFQAEQSDKRVLATLDDPGQAVYTSFHTTFTHNLESTEGHDLSDLPPECFEEGEHIGQFTTEAELPILLANLRRLAEGVTFEDARGVLFWDMGEDTPTPDAVMRTPDEAVRMDRDRESHFQFVPVERAADALAALPNGYFYGSLNPMQSYAVAKHLEDKHGFGLFGVGARYFGYRSAAPATSDAATALARDIVSLYGDAPPQAVTALADAIEGKDWLLLRYTES